MWRFLGTGKVWGEDIVLDSRELMDHSQAVALTYVEAYTLRRNDLDDVLSEYPEPAARVAKAARRIALQRAMLKYLALARGQTGPRSVVLKEVARGYISVNETFTTEQKVDQVYELVVNGVKKESPVTAPESALTPTQMAERLVPGPNAGVVTAPVSAAPPRGGDEQASKQLAALSGQVQQLVASQAALTELVKTMSSQIQTLQQAQPL